MSGQASSPPPKDQGPVSASSPDLSYQNESGEENIPLVEESIGTSDLVPSPPRQAREINQVGDAPATGAGSHQADDQLRSEYDRRSNDSQLSVRKAPIAGRTVEPVRIGLWGAPSSGKTTMLAALGVSLGQGSNTLGKWLIVPENDSSSELLTSLTHRLVISRRFPEPTPIGAMREISWNLVGDIAQTKFAPRRKLWVRGSVECRFRLNLVDVSGESFGSFPIDQHIADSALDILT